MSVASEISRLQTAKAGLKTAIEGKGVTVSSSAKLDDYPALVASIDGGGGGGGGGTTDWESIAKGMLDGSTTFEAPSNINIDASVPFICNKRKMTGTAILKSGITTIAQGAFSGCSVSGMTIPNSVTSIGQQAFEGSGITSLVMPNTVTSLGFYAIRNCVNLSSVVISNTLTTLSAGCFAGCTALTSVTIPSSITTIAQEVFMMTGLISVIVPSSVTSLGASVFRQCSLLESISLPNTITEIKAQAFWRCSKLASITIPSSVTSIENAAISECTGLNEIIFEGSTPPTLANNTNCIGATSYSYPIYVPDAAVNTYKTSGNFVAYASRIKGISERV